MAQKRRVIPDVGRSADQQDSVDNDIYLKAREVALQAAVDAVAFFPIWLGHGEWTTLFGGPANTELVGVGGSANQGIAALGLNDAATEIVHANVRIPDGVSTVTLKFVFAMVSDDAGNVVIGFALNSMAAGESAANESLDMEVVAIPGTAQEIKVETITQSITISAGDFLGLGARRTGNDGADTATGDLLFLGALIEFT